MMHLYWAWTKPEMAKGVTKGIVLCGVNLVPQDQFTVELKKVTCKECLAMSKRKPEPAPVKKEEPKAPALKGLNARGKLEYPASAVIVMAIKHNIRKAGSAKAERFQVLLNHNGKTYGEYIKAGGNPLTLKNAVNDFLCEVQE